MKPRRTQQRGMTAIEVLAATVLASLMLAAVAGLLGGLARQERILRAKTHSPPWHQQFTAELTWDLQNSRRFVVVSDGVRLEGFAARDFVTGRPTGRAAVIEYFLLDTASGRWLVRRERHADELTNDGSSRAEVVCCGMDRLQWGSVAIDQVALSAIGPKVPPAAALTALPERVGVQLYGPGSTTPVFDRALHIR